MAEMTGTERRPALVPALLVAAMLASLVWLLLPVLAEAKLAANHNETLVADE